MQYTTIHKTKKVNVIMLSNGGVDIMQRTVMTPREANAMCAAIQTAIFPHLPTGRVVGKAPELAMGYQQRRSDPQGEPLWSKNLPRDVYEEVAKGLSSATEIGKFHSAGLRGASIEAEQKMRLVKDALKNSDGA